MTLKHFIAPVFLLVTFSLWYCQKSPQPELNTPTQSLLQSIDRSTCPIENPGLEPSCNAEILVRCVGVAPGYTFSTWYVAGTWNSYENGTSCSFNFTLAGGIGGGFQQGVWYPIPQALTKQYLLDTYCNPGTGNQLECIVYTSGGDAFNVSQWTMYVDIRSGNKITTYHMNGATGFMTPVSIAHLPNPNIAFDRTDVDFLANCSNMGAQGVFCNPMLGCTNCGEIIDGDTK